MTTQYFCNYGLNPKFDQHFATSDIVISGIGDEGAVRIVELPQHRFFLATLFLPQVASTPENPHPLITAYLQAAQRPVTSYKTTVTSSSQP